MSLVIELLQNMIIYRCHRRRCVYAFTGRSGTQSPTSSQALLRLRADQNVSNAPCIVATKEKASAVER